MTFTEALMSMAKAASNAKVNDWGVEPHVDVLTDNNEIVYVFEHKHEAMSMQTELRHGTVIQMPVHWKSEINSEWKEIIFNDKDVYWAVYDASLRITEEMSGIKIKRYSWLR